MQSYRDWDNDSGIVAYEIGEDFIIVQFRSGRETFYKYSCGSAGFQHVNEMKRLAQQGDGLNAYIIDNKVRFESKC
jgi:hypothetical protein